MRRSAFALLVFALTVPVIGGVAAFARQDIKPAADKWRPKDGTYARSGKDFDERCGEFGELLIDLFCLLPCGRATTLR